MPDEKFYKDICYAEISGDILVFHLGKCKFQEEDLLIIGLSQFIEVVSLKKPRYIIIEKKNVKTKMLDHLKDYLKHQGIDELMNLGIRKILFVVSEERYKEINGKVGYRGIEAFTDIDSCLSVIEKNRKKHQPPKGSV